MTAAHLVAVEVPGSVDPWRRLGLVVDGVDVVTANGRIRTGADRVRLVVEGEASGLPTDLDGVPLAAGERGDVESADVELDHIVLMTSSLERTSRRIADVLGLEQRRVRETEHVRQAFHRFADPGDARGCIVEVVERADLVETSLWGLVLIVSDLDVAVAAAGGLIGTPKTAVQPGRRIATVSRDAGLPLAVAVMSR